ncbi:MAG: sigma-70 family RNA polymerase sigma factor [Planctomycetota bacterium]
MEYGRLTDEEAMAAFRLSADEKLFEELVRRHTGRALLAAQAMLGDATAAEDAVQECFLRLIRARSSYEPGKPFAGWLVTILRNICRDELLRRKRKAQAEANLQASAVAPEADSPAEEQEENQIVQASFAELPLLDREILVLRIHGGLEFHEIGARCGLSAEAAKKRAYRALERLRRR